MDQYSKEGRKLRPRKSAAGSAASSEKVEYHSGERKSYGESRGSYGEHRNYGEHRSYGGSRGSSSYRDRPRRSYGESRGEGEGERKNFYGSKPSYGSKPGFGRKPGAGTGRPGAGTGRPGAGSSRPGSGRSSFSSKPGFGSKPGTRGGARKPAGKTSAFNKQTNEGIDRMISRRPVVNGREADFENVPQTMIKDEIRLNKFIANSGVCSRREADTLIQAGVVTVNGEVVTELGTKVNIYEDDIRFNGERLKGEEKVYIVMNKPKGYVTTASDPHAEKTVIDLVKGCKSRVYPVGRLDKNTTGVLMLTNDGEIAERLTHPSYDKKKIYQVALDKELSREDYEKILSGVILSDGEVRADELEFIDESDHRKLGIEIHSGKNRIVRRIFESFGYSVKALDRVYFAGLTKKGLKKGEWRYLTEGESNILKMGAYV